MLVCKRQQRNLHQNGKVILFAQSIFIPRFPQKTTHTVQLPYSSASLCIAVNYNLVVCEDYDDDYVIVAGDVGGGGGDDAQEGWKECK